MRKPKAIRAAVARVNITPPVGIEMSGYAGRKPSVAFSDDLYATALIVADGTTKAVVMSLDLIDLDTEYVEEVAAEMQRRTRIPAENLVCCCTHTHFGPTTRKRDGDPWKSDTAAYMADLKFKLAGVVQEANSRLKPATLSIGRATSRMAVNRRERIADGTIILGVNPDGPADHEIVGLRVDGPGDRPLAFAFNYAAHGTSQLSSCRRISADHPGPACRIVEDATGAACLYLQGACGNVRPVLQDDDPEIPRRLGAMLGGAAIEAYETAEPIESVPVRVASRTVKLPAKAFASKAEAKRVIAHWKGEAERLTRQNAAKDRVSWARRLMAHGEAALESMQGGKPLPPVMSPMWAVRMGDFGLATAPGEIFVQIGRAVKDRSPLPHTMFLGYTNGHIGYVPVPEAYPHGGYEVERACRVAPDAAGIITNTALSLLRKLKRGGK